MNHFDTEEITLICLYNAGSSSPVERSSMQRRVRSMERSGMVIPSWGMR